MEKITDNKLLDLIVPDVVAERLDNVYLESPVEYVFNHCGQNLLGVYAGTAIPLSELYGNESFAGFFQRECACSIKFNNSPWRYGKKDLVFSKGYLESLVHEQIHIAAWIYYGEKPGHESFFHGQAYREIASKCGIEVSVEGVHTKVEGPFKSVVLEKFGLNNSDFNPVGNRLLLTR